MVKIQLQKILWILTITMPASALGQIISMSSTLAPSDTVSTKFLSVTQSPNQTGSLYMGSVANRTQGPDVGEKIERTAHLMRLNEAGDVIWSKGITHHSSWATGISSAAVTDNGFMVNGCLDSLPESNDLFEIDHSGNVLWSKNFSYGTGSETWILNKLIKVQGGYLNLGVTNTTQIICHKLDATGNIIWQKGYDLTDEFTSVRTTVSHAMELQDGAYLLVANLQTTVFNPPYERENVMLKINTDGSLNWANSIGNGDLNRVYYVHEEENGNLILVGEFYEDDETYDAAVYRFDAAGNLNLAKGYSAASGAGKWIGPNGDDWFLYTERNQLIQLDSDFEVIGAKATNLERTEAHSCIQAEDGSIVCGQWIKTATNWDALYDYGLSRTELNLDLSCLDSVVELESYSLLHFIESLDVSVYNTQFFEATTDITLEDMPFEAEDICFGVGIDEHVKHDSVEPLWTVYPNPTQGEVYLDLSQIQGSYELSVFNELGQSVYKTTVNGSTEKLDLSGFESGVYSIRLVGSGKSQTKRVALIKQW